MIKRVSVAKFREDLANDSETGIPLYKDRCVVFHGTRHVFLDSILEYGLLSFTKIPLVQTLEEVDNIILRVSGKHMTEWDDRERVSLTTNFVKASGYAKHGGVEFDLFARKVESELTIQNQAEEAPGGLYGRQRMSEIEYKNLRQIIEMLDSLDDAPIVVVVEYDPNTMDVHNETDEFKVVSVPTEKIVVIVEFDG